MNYFDYAATTPLHPEAALVYTELSISCYGNTSSLHEIGTEAENMLEFCRAELAAMLNVESAGVYFTSGGTESNLLSIISLAKANRAKGNHIITTLGEHPSVDSALEYLKEDGFDITKIPFTKDGLINLDTFKKAIKPNTILVSVQHINPEIGTIQPLEEISEIVKEYGILLHSDCVQSFGKIDLARIVNCVDSLTISAHKTYGPKGVGVAYIHPRHRIIPVFPGLVHESGFKGGTVNVPGIAAFITATKQLTDPQELNEKHTKFRDAFLTKILKYPEFFTVYDCNDRNIQMPQIIGLRITNVEGQLMMLELNRHGFAISTGSACQVGQQTSSKAMMALQVDPQKAKEFIRISFGESTTLTSVDALAEQLVKIRKQIHTTQSASNHKIERTSI
ncbi:IscS subfamily cysteine desulfurase [Sporosarcina sp. Marseille-Q4063]|uniref:IscS subfamily cysteine desulfurase n=1 Tax=Sporosarcina sp. Marseille-Q4063 TaxID=2810514 RepID=UPI001BB0D3C1|nr:IscS subfamily cysteine desulfurase [Sporosarcina sp. Marseille-Q4063]QUW20974.1 IscS subfamily cysteine desulfurase [Sporosarcina sp. Marseille-Q4063]